MLNRIVLIGRLTKEPEMRYTGNGTAFTRFTLAVQRNYRNQSGEYEADFIDIVTWRKLAEHCAQYLNKGQLVAVEGSLQISKNTKNGKTYVNANVIADNVRFLEWPKKQQEENDDAFDDLLPDDFEIPL